MARLLKRYRSLSPAARASLWYALCSIVQKCIGLVVVPIYTRLMSPEAYGSYSIFQSWYSIAVIVVSLNLSQYVFQNGMTKYPKNRSEFSSAMLGLSTTSALVWVAAFLMAPEFWSGLLGISAPFVFILLLRCIITPAYDYWSARLRYEFRYKGVVAVTLALTILTPAASVPAIMVAENKIAAALVCQIVVMMGVYAVPLISILRKSRKLINLEYWSFALRFNIPLIPHFLSTTVLSQADRLMIGAICGEAQAAIYSVAYSAALAMQLVHSAINQSLIPWTYQKMNEGSTSSLRGLTKTLLCVVGLCCLALTVCAPEIMGLLAPASYYEGVYAIPPVAASVMLMFLYNLFATVEYFFEETKAVMFASLAGAILNVALNYALLPIFGFVVAGYTTLMCYVFYSVGHCLLMKRAMKLHGFTENVYDVKGIAGITVAFVAAMLLMGLFYPFPIARYILIAVALVAVVTKRDVLKMALASMGSKVQEGFDGDQKNR